MKVQKIACAPTPVFTRRAAGHHTQTNTNKQISTGLNTACAWFCFGVGLDFVSRRINFFKSPLKNSFAINGLIASTAGVVTGIKGLKNSSSSKS